MMFSRSLYIYIVLYILYIIYIYILHIYIIYISYFAGQKIPIFQHGHGIPPQRPLEAWGLWVPPMAAAGIQTKESHTRPEMGKFSHSNSCGI